MAVGIIAEFNPFHNGHIRLLKYVKKRFPNDKIIVVLTGKFSQRGEYNVISFAQRKKYALAYGADKVIKLSFEQSVQAAHIFAKNAVDNLYKHKIDKLIFGSEDNNIKQKKELALFLKNNENLFNSVFKKHIKNKGMSYPAAFANTLMELTGKNYTLPNDILGFEYIKHIVNNDLPIRVYSIKRNVNFHDNNAKGKYASATYLRKLIKDKKSIEKFSPITLKRTYFIEKKYKYFCKIIQNIQKEKLFSIPLISEGIENLLIKQSYLNNNYDSFIEACTSKRYTTSRIKRIFAWIVYKAGELVEG